MKKILLAAVALAAFTVAPAIAADLGRPAPVYKAPPPPAPVFTWTGCYLGGGGGYGMWNQDISATAPPDDTIGSGVSLTTTAGGRGWFGTAQVGCDYQFSSDWVIGAFGDGDFGNLKGTPEISDTAFAGNERQKWSWAVGARIGYVVFPQLLAYFSGGFTEAHFNAFELFNAGDGDLLDEHVPSHTYHGWFIGTGYEYALKWFPGLFWKTEYRYSQYSGVDLPVLFDDGSGTDFTIHAKKFEQTIRSELVWRFNWGGVARPY
jgi:outer membrane immunogenic protein